MVSQDQHGEKECTLGGSFGLVVQFLLLCVCMLALYLKKKREEFKGSKRTWRDFMFDSSKQLAGAGWVHVLNMGCAVLLGMFSGAAADACEWYWVEIMIDTTLGVFVEFLFLEVYTKQLEKLTNFSGAFKTGEYIDKETGELNTMNYLKQLAVWLLVISSMKLCMVFVMIAGKAPLEHFAHTFVGYFDETPQFKLILVMVITPGVMNCVQFWLTDNFLKAGGEDETMDWVRRTTIDTIEMIKNHHDDLFIVVMQFVALGGLFCGIELPPLWFGFVSVFSFFFGLYFWYKGLHQLGTRRVPFMPAPYEDETPIYDGVFSVTRHPQYFGMICIGFAVVLRRPTQWHRYFWFILLVAALDKKAEKEEHYMLQTFRDTYSPYQGRVPKFIPWFDMTLLDFFFSVKQIKADRYPPMPSFEDAFSVWISNIKLGAKLESWTWPKRIKLLHENVKAQSSAIYKPRDFLQEARSSLLSVTDMTSKEFHPKWGADGGDDDTATPGILKPLAKLAISGEKEAGLPEWAFDKDVLKVCERTEDGSSPRELAPLMASTCGPGVRWAFRALANHQALFLFMPFFSYLLSSCDDKGGFATCFDAPLFGILMIHLASAAWIQKKCVESVIVPQLGVAPKFELGPLLFNKFPFGLWLGVFTAMQMGCLLDTFTNAEVLGKAMATSECPEAYTRINFIWGKVMSQSVTAKLFGFTEFDFSNEMVFCYLVMLAQPLFALIYSVPIEKDVSYEVGRADSELFPCKDESHGHHSQKLHYRTMYDRLIGTTHGNVLMVLAESTRMEAVTFQDRARAQFRLDELKTDRKDEWQLSFIRIVENQLCRGVVRFILVGLVQNAMQLNVQISVLALTKEATGQLDNQILFSVVMSLLNCLGDFPDIIDVTMIVWRARKELFVDELQIESIAEEVKMLQQKVRNLLLRFAIYVLVYVCVICYAVSKMFGVFLCADHILNMDGCADIGKLVNMTSLLG
eukprot:TRINITY_DN25319_c0_g4_i1.p1 TRINITY_DN25319_c0_g4~~TRINITY_DN25319_c0_g4_i1.p1  ORF type:complete len:970 (-),score=200.96 TRINITY_DN25319_c0_g4_i1:64-2973(-)